METDCRKILTAKLHTWESAQTITAKWKADGNKVVFTNGVFDLLHKGHVMYLASAANEGHKLIVGLNSDNSVRRIKGNDRPINDQDTRALVLAALFFVDAVVIFDEDTPLMLISTLLPDILIKGADYQIGNIIGGKEIIANGGSVKTVPFIAGYSSTAIIERLKK